MSLTCTCGRRMSCIDTRPVDDGTTKRRYRCACGERSITREAVLDKNGRTPSEAAEYERGMAAGMNRMMAAMRKFALTMDELKG